MPSLKFNSLDINYEVSGTGPLLILHHGFGSWGRDWILGGWLDALNPHSTVLIFDSVGHGLSTRSHNRSDHTVEKRAALVIALADHMETDKFGFLGFSMGGRTGFEIAASNPDRLSLLAIGGMDLRPPATEKDRFERNIRILRSGRTKSIETPNGDRPGNDPLALAASHEALLQWSGANNRLSNHTAPTLLFCGEKDQHFDNAKQTAKNMKFEFAALPDTDHYSTFFSSPQAVSAVTRFVSNQLT